MHFTIPMYNHGMMKGNIILTNMESCTIENINDLWTKCEQEIDSVFYEDIDDAINNIKYQLRIYFDEQVSRLEVKYGITPEIYHNILNDYEKIQTRLDKILLVSKKYIPEDRRSAWIKDLVENAECKYSYFV